MARTLTEHFGEGNPFLEIFEENGSENIPNVNVVTLDLFKQERDIKTKVESLRSDPEAARAFIDGQGGSNLPERTRNLIKFELLKIHGEEDFKRRRYEDAMSKYVRAVHAKYGDDFPIPVSPEHGVVRSDAYIKLDPGKETIELMKFSNDIAHCLIKLDRKEEALDWLEETSVIIRNFAFSQPTPNFDWFSYDMHVKDYYVQQVAAASLACNVFLELGNTASAMHRRWRCTTTTASAPFPGSRKEMESLVTAPDVRSMSQTRHPDPKLVRNLRLKDESLQVLGSWQKIDVPKSSIIPSRYGFAHFVWKSRLYVGGGVKAAGAGCYHDLWYINLEKPSDGWHALPPYPNKQMEFSGYLMIVHEDKAYMFTGSPSLDVFDLKAEKWGQIQTMYKRDQEGLWPYKGLRLELHAAHILNGKMYIFGGSPPSSPLGCDMLMVLDLTKFPPQWGRLSGSAREMKADFLTPGPRCYTSSWVDPKEEKIYVLYGMADRQTNYLAQMPHGSMNSYAYDDFWSWSVPKKKWQRERVAGNPPCPRAEMAGVYAHGVNRAVVFGGYHPTLPVFYPEKDEGFAYSYFADTFIFEPPACSQNCAKWKQVLTRGFPTYRAQAALVSDPDTGKIFLFGGYTNCEYLPAAKKLISRSFGDLWQLKIDVPGGFFDGVNLGGKQNCQGWSVAALFHLWKRWTMEEMRRNVQRKGFLL